MPRQSTSAFSQLQQHARKLLVGLASDIRSRKGDLAQLEQDFEKLTGIAGLRAAVSAPKRVRTTGRRINWSEVLAKLPKEFTASDVRKLRGMKAKRPSEIFAGITRWIDSGVVKKRKRGIYLRTK